MISRKTLMQSKFRLPLLILNFFLALTAIPGGVALIAGFYPPPPELLTGSPFTGYLVPGLALSIIVGGSGLIAAVMLLKQQQGASCFSLGAAVIILIFEIVEIVIIGSPEGAARNMQITYIMLGLLSGAISLAVIFKRQFENNLKK